MISKMPGNLDNHSSNKSISPVVGGVQTGSLTSVSVVCVFDPYLVMHPGFLTEHVTAPGPSHVL